MLAAAKVAIVLEVVLEVVELVDFKGVVPVEVGKVLVDAGKLLAVNYFPANNFNC